MTKQLNVNLSFTADTEKAKAKINELYKALNQVAATSASAPNLFNTTQLKEGVQAAKELQQHLQAAVDVNTGKLNLSAFSASLKASGRSLTTFKKQLEALGPAGEHAFLQISQAIATAEAPLRKTNSLLTEFSTSMKNTVRWQISSSILHGFMGTISSTVGYAQDLNESLNNIRIVTGNNTEQMAKFAKEANKAAQALSTTTVEYTDAALIYYQQGLNEQQVKERTEITVKMANVARESAQVVSDQLTAVWNNFYENGTQPLEHYADAMTALGAATASSTDEIAGGLEKFASIADMIGLSFDNAAAALATITATTRQSEDVVGTALKTIFARIQGLQLGETLDDGTTLNKYSRALEKVGISIYDAGGGLKDMDLILAEMGAKWETLNKDQQVALAQTVAGVRQYNQLVSFMDNFDFYEQNLATAQNSEGALDQQAAIYAESWEAARNRVTAAAENIYDSLLDDEFFIKLTNLFADFLEGLGGFVDGFGGMESVLSTIGAFITQKLAKEAPAALQTIKQDLMQISGQAYNIANNEQQKNITWLEKEGKSQRKTFKDSGEGSLAYIAEVSMLEQIAIQKNKLIQYSDQYSEAERAHAEQEIANLQTISDLLTEKGKRYDDLKDKASNIEYNIVDSVKDSEKRGEAQDTVIDLADQNIQLASLRQTQEYFKNLDKDIKNVDISAEKMKSRLKEFINFQKGKASGETKSYWEELSKQLDQVTKEGEEAKKELAEIVNGSGINEQITNASDNVKALIEKLKGIDGINIKSIDNLIHTTAEIGTTGTEVVVALNNVEEGFEHLKPHVASTSEAVMSFGGALMQMNSIAESLTSLKEIFSNEDATAIEKISALIAFLTQVMFTLNTMQEFSTVLTNLNTASRIANAGATNAQTEATEEHTKALMRENAEQQRANLTNLISLDKIKEAFKKIKGKIKGLPKALPAVGKALGKLVPVIGSVIIGYTVLTKAVEAVAAAWEKYKNSTPEGQLELAQKESMRLTEELNKAREASESLKNSIESYDSAINKIKTLEEGTQEWREAIEEANNSAREMIENNKGLIGKYSFNIESGLIEFDKGALEEIQKNIDEKQRNLQIQKIISNNAVIETKQKVSNNKIGHSDKQRQAYSDLLDAYQKNGGNLEKAKQDIEPNYVSNILELLGKTDAELEALCREMVNNTKAISENNKQIANTAFSDNSQYQKFSNKNFLSEVLGKQVEEKAQEIYDDVDLTTAQNQYAAENEYRIKRDFAGTTTFYNKEGEKVEGITDEMVRRTVAYNDAINEVNNSMEDTVKSVQSLINKEKSLSTTNEKTIDGYKKVREELINSREDFGLTEEQINSYINTYGNMKDMSAASVISSNFANWNWSNTNLAESDFNSAAEFLVNNLEDVGSITKDQQIDIVVNISASSTSFDDFMRNFEQGINEAILNSVENSSSNIEGVIARIKETGSLSSEDLLSLEQDENFQEYLEAAGQSMLDFTQKTYSEKYNIITAFYANLKGMENESLQISKENYINDLAEFQAIIDYKRALANNNEEVIKGVKEEFSQVDFEAYLDMDISEVEDKMEKVQEKIDEIDGRQIKLDMEWESTDAIEESLKQAAAFTKLIVEDTKKAGNSYQMTAAQAREWMQVYPELFAKATTTTDGLISLNADYVNNFIQGQEASADASIEANIIELESRLHTLEGEREAYIADLELAKSNAVGQQELANASKEYLAETREKLTQYYIDLGFDEVGAQQQALETMELNEKEYSRLVAEASTRNAQNQIDSMEDSATAQVSVLSQLFTKIREFKNKAGKMLSTVWAALKGEITWKEASEAFGTVVISATTGLSGLNPYDDEGNFKTGDKHIRQAILEEVNAKTAKDYEVKIADLTTRINNIGAELAYNKALQAQTLDKYGSTDPDDVSGSKDKSGSKERERAIKELTKIAERYHVITKEIEAQQHLLEKISKAKDRAYGKNKLYLMDQEIDKLKTLYEKQSLLLDAQTLYLASDQIAITDKFAYATFDKNGDISNHNVLVQDITDKLNAVKNQYNKVKTEEAEKAVEAAEKEYEVNMGLLEQYEETLANLREQEQLLIDLEHQIQDMNYEKLMYQLELKLTISDIDLRRIDYYLSKYADNFYKIAESASLLMGQIDPNKSSIEANQLAKEELDKAYAEGDISQADYIAGLQQIKDNLYGTLETLNELDKTMLHYYEDTLAKATEELADHTDHLEHLTNVFDHYINLLNILGKQKDYEAMGDFLGGKAETLRDRLDVAKEYYNMLVEQKEDIEAKLNAAIAAGDEAAVELYKEEWDAIVDAVDEAQEEVLSLTEEWAEAMKAVIENNMAEIADTLEKNLTGGTSFDELMDGFDKLNTRQEEYLTKTNQIYETNKLMRTANKALDETSNTAAKQKIKNFIEETKKLQENTKLSKLELEIQQAKYELLLAELALEEAKNAKSTVRIAKDNEGNFGYVFTANEDVIDNIQQEIEDAQNNLYNISLEAQQEYTEKYLQATQEMYDELAELQEMYLNGEIESEEEYNRRKEEILNHYLNPEDGVLTTYSNLYNIAVQADANATADYWAKDYGNMTQNTEDWRDAVNEYLEDIEQETENWKDVSEQANEDVQGALENSTEATEELIEESEELADTISRDVIDALEDELDAVQDITDAYAEQREELLDLIDVIEQYIATLEQEIKHNINNLTGELANQTQQDSNTSYNKYTDYGMLALKKAAQGKYSEAQQALNTKVAKIKGEEDRDYDPSYEQELIRQIQSELSDAERAALLKELEQLEKSGYTSASAKGVLSKYGIAAYDTGGYTGQWGPEGKLAMLHEKEMVLNADDTENLLSIISFVRDLVGKIDGWAQFQSLFNLNPIPGFHSIGQTLEQQVTIQAEFPNATDRYEIEEAFNSLVNKASQFANRKR